MTTQVRIRKRETSPVDRAVSAPARRKKSPSIIVSRSNQEDSRPSTSMTRVSTSFGRPQSGETNKSGRIGSRTPDHSHLKSKLTAWKEEK